MTSADFLEGMRRLASSVSVITTDGPGGRAGVTVSAMCSVSAEPPSLLVCVHHLSPACPAIAQNGWFCVNALREDQARISEVFAGRIEAPEGGKFACASWDIGRSGVPVLRDSLATFECRVSQRHVQGTHCVFIAEVVEVASASGRPLVHADRSYGVPAPLTVPGG